MRVTISGIYYKRNKKKCTYIIGDPCLVKWKNRAENVSGFLHAAFDTATVIRVHYRLRVIHSYAHI